MTTIASDLERRFFEAISRQSRMRLPCTGNESHVDVIAFQHNHPYVETEYGTIWFYWLEVRPDNEWFSRVYDSRIITIGINAALLGDDLTDEQLDFIARDGSYALGDDTFQVYLRVF